MEDKKRFLLRIDPGTYHAIEKWAADELRSVNGQIEFLLSWALARARRLPLADGRRQAANPAGRHARAADDDTRPAPEDSRQQRED